jgi:2-polyprenyl-3-methyl-5-hydroxy-6-metoxy-1,4-benzoquinol methylase
MDNKEIFDTYLTNQYSESEKVNFNNSPEVLALLKKNKKVLDHNLKSFFESTIKKESKILDLGCGYGSFLYFLQALKYKNVTGLDISTEELDICKRIFGSFNFIQKDIFEYLDSTTEKFNVIYLSHVLEHITKDKIFDFLGGIKKILTDDGLLVIIIPNSGAYFHSGVARYVDITHELGFTDKSLRQVLILAGYKDISIKNYFGARNLLLNILRKVALFLFEIFIQILGYEKQYIYTPSILAIIKK